MKTNPIREQELTGDVNLSDIELETFHSADQNQAHAEKKKYHSSAMYAASKWHGTVKHVKSHNAGHGLLPTQM